VENWSFSDPPEMGKPQMAADLATSEAPGLLQPLGGCKAALGNAQGRECNCPAVASRPFQKSRVAAANRGTFYQLKPRMDGCLQLGFEMSRLHMPGRLGKEQTRTRL